VAVPSFIEILEARGVLLADGGTGTNYQDMGIEPGIAPEEWVFDEPERVVDLHRSFADVGCDLVSTCTFGGSPIRLEDGPLAGRARELNARGAELARRAVGDVLLVAGAVGPTGQLVEPFGPLTKDMALEAFAEQALGLAEGGVDVMLLETFFTLDEGLWAAEAIRAVSDLPIVMSFSFDQGTRTMMGLSPAELTAAVDGTGVAALGANCGRSLQDTAQLVSEFRDAGVTQPLWIKPNAGVPQVTAAGVVYPEDPQSFAMAVAEFARHGARIGGGCCGATPEHLAALAEALGR
jgi:5-methyltetrahydrofolate--homocysteine methyltransferase